METSESFDPTEGTLVVDCDACGADVVEGQIHDCPVLGAAVTVGRLR